MRHVIKSFFYIILIVAAFVLIGCAGDNDKGPENMVWDRESWDETNWN